MGAGVQEFLVLEFLVQECLVNPRTPAHPHDHTEEKL
jgi:hypothetical protein